MPTGIEIKGFLEVSMLDWEGKVASVIFLPGCNFRCPYCHNGELVNTPAKLATVPLKRVVETLEAHRGWIDGVVITGGEPTMHPNLPEFIDFFKSAGWGVKLDTNGSNPEMLRRLVAEGKLDSVAMDIKAPLTDIEYARAAGGKVALSAIRQSLDLLMQGEVDYELRTTACPALLDEGGWVRLLEAVKGCRRLVLQNFNPTHAQEPDFRRIQPFTREELEKFARLAGNYVQVCRIKG